MRHVAGRSWVVNICWIRHKAASNSMNWGVIHPVCRIQPFTPHCISIWQDLSIPARRTKAANMPVMIHPVGGTSGPRTQRKESAVRFMRHRVPQDCQREQLAIFRRHRLQRQHSRSVGSDKLDKLTIDNRANLSIIDNR
jgi:hypothetical protein